MTTPFVISTNSDDVTDSLSSSASVDPTTDAIGDVLVLHIQVSLLVVYIMMTKKKEIILSNLVL